MRAFAAASLLVRAQLVPLDPADLVEGLGRPPDQVERVEADERVRGPDRDRAVDPLGAVTRHELQLPGPSVAELVEELPDGGLGTALARPDHPAGHVVAHHCQVTLALLVLDLIDRDGDEPVEQIDLGERFIGNADTHRVHRPPRHRVACSRSGLVRRDRVVDHQVLERATERAVMARPWHRRDRWTVHRAAHPPPDRFELNGRVRGVDVTPTTQPTAVVVPGRHHRAPPAPAPVTDRQPNPDNQMGPVPVHLDQLVAAHHNQMTQPQHALE